MDPEVQCHGKKDNPPWYLWSRYGGFLTSGGQDMNGNGNAHRNGKADDRSEYNTTVFFALRAVGQSR